MKITKFFVVACLLLSLALSEALAEPRGLHKGAIESGFGFYDGDQNILGAERSFDGDSVAVSGHYFIIEQVSVGISKAKAELDYGATLNNLTCDVEGTTVSASFHPERMNIFTGTGMGYSIGVSSTENDTKCEDDYFYYNTINSDAEYLHFGWEQGLGDGNSFSINFSSNTDDLFDDRTIGFSFNRASVSGFVLSAGIFLTQTAEDAAGNNSDYRTFVISGGFYF